eukprot:Anaeramoba_ignava/a223884_21.p2 GENE.a223884_21~~a223884_21.p2  ORF type:complete len:271 (+),score=-2.07 a223884_21:1602-2414(+)
MNMYEPYRQQGNITVSINWDRNTAIGFIETLALVLVMLLLFSFIKPPEKKWARMLQQRNTLASWEVIELSIGPGDGTGAVSGNMAEDGKKHKGRKPNDYLTDAQIKGRSAKNAKKSDNVTDEASENMVPSAIAMSDEKGEDTKGNGNEDIGDPDGTPDGTGLSDHGTGPGKMGYGPISFGGGGNRLVRSKPSKPAYPDDVNIRKAVVRVRFTVKPDGRVVGVYAIKKVHPVLDRIAINYVKRYRFNELKPEEGEPAKDMVGTINIVFSKT